MKQTLIFVHIPKTAGSTFSEILARQYENTFQISGSNPFQSIQEFKTLSKSERNKFDCIKGHLSNQLIDYVENPLTVTFIRNPIEHFLSNFYYIKRATWNRYHYIVKDLKLEEFIELAPEIAIDNMQTRYLSESSNWHSISNGKPINIIDEDLLGKAINKLKNFDFVFPVEEFDKSLLTLKEQLNWTCPFYITKNKTNKRPLVSEFSLETIEKIKFLNRQDIDLYNYTLELIDFRMQEYKIPQQKLIWFKIQNKFFRKKI